MAQTTVEAAHSQRIGTHIVDVDVHPAAPSYNDVRRHLPPTWRQVDWERFQGSQPIYASPSPTSVFRADTMPPGGGIPGSDPAFMEKQLLEEAGVDFAILWPLVVRHVPDVRHESVVSAATNQWLADTWLSRHNRHRRFRGTIIVSAIDPAGAVREIETWAGQEEFVQVGFDPLGIPPLGDERYYPIYEAAVAHDLPIAMHFITSPSMNLLGPVGFASYGVEFHVVMSLAFATHIASMISEGTFERFPTLKVVLLEAGVSWIVPLLWRLDKRWSVIQKETPGLQRRPAEYFRDHFRVATQPIEEPDNLRDLVRMFDWVSADQTLLFATDYPHWDYDDPRQVIARLPSRLRNRIMWQSAAELYGLRFDGAKASAE
jgi:predicted TIM-barrel fold metal-dependent hydrolase